MTPYARKLIDAVANASADIEISYERGTAKDAAAADDEWKRAYQRLEQYMERVQGLARQGRGAPA